jgi:hypothetical protein
MVQLAKGLAECVLTGPGRQTQLAKAYIAGPTGPQLAKGLADCGLLPWTAADGSHSAAFSIAALFRMNES